MSESNRIGQMEKLNCNAVAKEASVEPKVRFGALILFTVVLIESRAFVLQHWSLDTDASRKTDVYSFSPRRIPGEDRLSCELSRVYTPCNWGNEWLSFEGLFGQWAMEAITAPNGDLNE